MNISPNANRLFNYFNYYRVGVSLLLIALTFAQKSFFAEFRFPDLFQIASLGYILVCAAYMLVFQFGLKARKRQILIAFMLDILCLHALLYLGPGLTKSGFENLVIISIAAGNIIVSGRIGFSFAALATLCSLGIALEQVLAGSSRFSNVAQAGLMGAIYFAAAFILQNLTARISQSESLAESREQDLLELQKLNQQIIQSMRTGIIVCTPDGMIKTCNQACRDLVDLGPDDDRIPPELGERLVLWQQQPSIRTTPFKRATDKPLVQANFSTLKQGRDEQVLIFIEDTRLMTQQAQQMKLASLGRLTASIAHEVRNPLGAISHATQLLAESTHLDAGDRKMTDIIQRHSERVNRIIENTLQISRRAEPRTEEIQLGSWLSHLVEEYQEQQRTPANIQLELLTPQASARFDPSQIAQVLCNLIDNGIRHGHDWQPDKPVIVRLDQTDDGTQAFVEVIDQGAGISPENRLHLFEPFFTTAAQGTGLGLYLSREICEANQAQLDYIETGADKSGACFRVLFAHYKRIV